MNGKEREMKKRPQKLIILDRDGVINYDSPEFIKSEDEWLPIAGSLEAIARLNANGFTVVVATNQSGIARGFYDLSTLERIHQKMHNALGRIGGEIDNIFVCPHGPRDNCLCRKPAPGLFYQIAENYDINFKDMIVPAVGDSLRDLQAAQTAGCHPMLTLTGNGAETAEKLTEMPDLKYIEIFRDLSEAVEALLSKQ